MAPRLDEALRELADSEPCRYISLAEFYWRPIVDKTLKAPLGTRFRYIRRIITIFGVSVFILLCVWGVFLRILLSDPASWFPQKTIALLLGAGLTLWGIRDFLQWWLRPVWPYPKRFDSDPQQRFKRFD